MDQGRDASRVLGNIFPLVMSLFLSELHEVCPAGEDDNNNHTIVESWDISYSSKVSTFQRKLGRVMYL